MRADYDNAADTIQIELEPIDRLDRDDATISGLLVGLCDGRAVMVDLIGTDVGVETRLKAAGDRYGLDAEALIVAAQAARTAPNRAVTLDVAVRAVP